MRTTQRRLEVPGHLLRGVAAMPIAAWLALALLAAHAPIASAADCTGDVSGAGTATFYTYTPGSGSCSFVGDDSEPLITAINVPDYAGSEMCGRYLRVTGPLGFVDVRVVDVCPGCDAGDLDLSSTAFAAIANPADGSAPVTWTTIPDPAPGTMFLLQSSATNAFYLQVQVRHHRYGVEKLEYLGPSGYVEAGRFFDNFFIVDASLGVPVPLPSPFTVRLTDVNGQQVVVEGVPLSADHLHPCFQEFPVCSGLDAPRPTTPRELALNLPAPNPFRRSTVFEFDLAHEGNVVLRLYDASGRRVNTLVDERLPAGRHRVEWRGLDASNRPLPSGVYFCRLSADSAVDQQRIVLAD